uniref:C2 DOCK-type domain-containing protein n=1 Tax=Tetranychus urticae TaxID=32264 RepID=T1L2P2_TETUR
MDAKWTPVEDRFKYGVAISNFSSDSSVVIQSALDLVVGETVSILLSIKDWYYGHKLGDNVRGIFPKSYIAIKDHVEEKIWYVSIVNIDHVKIFHRFPVLRWKSQLLQKKSQLFCENGKRVKGEIIENDHKGQGLWISYKLLLGDLEQAHGDSPHLISQYTKIARRMGFPEIILPGDVRNDLYLTLISGDFSSKASNAKNIEVTIRVCNDRGHILPEAITVGPGLSLGSEYKSVVYYHEEKPKWMETIKISLDIEDFRTSHLKITYKHRSSNESKDKNEKPFAFSFIRLMNENGTTLKDEIHELLIYKIDGKKYDETDSNVSYFKLPSTRSELESKIPKATYSNSGSSLKLAFSNISVPGLTLNPRDVCLVSSIVCSTKLTQTLICLDSCLLAFMKVDGEDIVKFLQDILDSLFKTLTDKESDEFVDLVFKALVFVVGLISDIKYQHFSPVLNVYIEKTFSAALAYNKLIIALRRYIDKLSAGRLQCDKLNGSLSLDASIGSYHEFNDSLFVISMMKSIGFLFKFIVRSRCLFLESQRLQRFDVPLDNMLINYDN